MNSLEPFAMNCGPLSEIIRGSRLRKAFFGALQQDLHAGFLDRSAQAPHQTAAGSVRHRAKVNKMCRVC